MSKFAAKFRTVKKTAVAAVGLVAQAVASGVLTGSALHWAQVVLAVATALGVYQVRNVPAAETTRSGHVINVYGTADPQAVAQAIQSRLAGKAAPVAPDDPTPPAA